MSQPTPPTGGQPRSITLPFMYEPRDYQLPILKALDTGGYKRAIAVWHRRSGKDKTFLNYLFKSMYERVGAYYYFFPTYRQGRKVIWQGMDRDGMRFIDHFPKELRARVHDLDMRIEAKNGSTFQVVGTDKIDAIVGANPVGCVYSEWSLQNPSAWDFVRPILAENGGWAVFNYTPRGKNHGWTLLEAAREYPEFWYSEVLTVKDTHAVDQKTLDQERREIVRKDGNDAFYQQEYMCNFDVPIQGAYYGNHMMIAETEKRIASVPYDKAALVHTAWDLGIDDSTSIWFFQIVGQEIHFIDYYESFGEGLEYYIKYLQDKPYTYGDHYAPHDIAVRELGTGKSRLETAKGLGIRFEVGKMLPIEDGIDAARTVLNRCWFDKEKCAKGISALVSYHKEWDEESQVFKKKPEHDWSSHGADAFRTFATGYRQLNSEAYTAETGGVNPYFPDMGIA